MSIGYHSKRERKIPNSWQIFLNEAIFPSWIKVIRSSGSWRIKRSSSYDGRPTKKGTMRSDKEVRTKEGYTMVAKGKIFEGGCAEMQRNRRGHHPDHRSSRKYRCVGWMCEQ